MMDLVQKIVIKMGVGPSFPMDFAIHSSFGDAGDHHTKVDN